MNKATHTRIVRLLAKGVTQAKIAEQVGVTRYFVSQTKLGRVAPYGKSKPGTTKTTKRGTPKKTAKRHAAKRAKKILRSRR